MITTQSRTCLKSTVVQAPVNRRMLDSTRVRAPIRHMTLPFHETAKTDLREGETLYSLVKRTGWATRVGNKWSFRLPTICVVNGQPVLQTRWRRTRVKADDVVEFWSKPWGGQGGSGKSILGIVAVIGLAVFAPWAAGAIAGPLFAAGSTALTIATTAIAGAIMVGGSLLISALSNPTQNGTPS